jgi:hypothetical protein
MKILCIKCGEIFESLIIDKAMAEKELFGATTRHVKTKHPAMFQEMQKAIGTCVLALTTCMHFNEFVTIPEDETEMQAAIDTTLEIVLAGLGYDPDEEFEDEDEPDGEEQPNVGVIEMEPTEEREESDKQVVES